MANFVLCSSPVYGHVAPMITIGAELVRRGHRVRLLTGSRFYDAIAGAGIEPVALPEESDYDDRDVDGAFPGRAKKKGIAKLKFDVDNIFAGGLTGQAHVLLELLADGDVDAVLAETAFGGAFAMLRDPAAARPPVIFCGVLPLILSSDDVPPFGPGLLPSTTVLGRVRDRALRFLVQKVVFGSSQKIFERKLRDLGVDLPVFFMDGPKLGDGFLQLTAPSFEYPRTDLPEGFEFVGPILPTADSAEFTPPEWWHELDSGKPVVHVTQGTIDNFDLNRVVVPTIRALADEDVLVVVATGGRPITDLPGDLPANALVTEFVPYSLLLPKVDVMVTNGGYGGAQFALAHGVPLIVAGDSEDKPEVAQRVAWSGTGINMKTGRPKPAAIRAAVQEILGTPAYRERAREIQAEIAGLSAVQTIADRMEAARVIAPPS
ncbi:glycosyltransferase [Antrihabitans stalactiti]|uniref:Glycosyltransferase n=1 Tax=Antrihabitans stalactiti TaxID=2584121 RepID=A0A848KA62_9NOCA|nr:nucleotide disphospho-sugar-binding domain-containing protein [Antrihabitans stalactiti]NMN94358.1 glycosyltransferase [Antrihabitans stalactiti]